MDPMRKFILSLLSLITVVCGGTIGYSPIEEWPLFESLYMTVITVATVGFKEIHDLSHEGKVFTILLIVFSAGTLAYTLGTLVTLGERTAIKDLELVASGGSYAF